MFAVNVAINLPVKNLFRQFTYSVPEALQFIDSGWRVVVPFSGQKVEGFVVERVPQPADQELRGKLKPVEAALGDTPWFDEEMLATAKWMADYYMCSLAEAMRLFVPGKSSIKRRAVRDAQGRLLYYVYNERLQEKTVLAYRINAAGRQVLAEGTLAKRAKGQHAALGILAQAGTLSVSELAQQGVSSAVARALAQNGLADAVQKRVLRNSYNTVQERGESLQLTAEQQDAAVKINQAIDAQRAQSFLLQGITGSGKTEVYLRAAAHAVDAGWQVLMLVPEIALTPQMVERFYQLFGEVVAVVHSELSLGQRSDTWRRIAAGEARIIIGTRSAVFAPVQKLGLLVVDEEGERTYKSDSAPRYHAISVAKKRCQTHGCPLLLASATPSIESYYYAKRGTYTLLELKERYNQTPLPKVEVVDMQKERENGNDGVFSRTLQDAMLENLGAGKQTLLLLNRRGYYTIISCASCNKPVYCPNCSIPMTYHKVNDSLMCHYCGHVQEMVKTCAFCGSPHLRKMGFGTQRLEEELSELVPQARILRMDADTTMSRYAYAEHFAEFRAGKYDIMLGTQMIGKGLDFPNVTLVGVLSVDKALYAGDFRSYERTFSLVTQVVGRGGRGSSAGRAILQTNMPDHYVLKLASKQAYEAFYEQEIALRRQLIFPPVCDICVIGFTGLREQEVQQAAQKTSQILRIQIQRQGFSYPIWVLEPVPCVYGKINGKYRYQLVIKCKNTKPYRDLIRAVLKEAGADRACAKVHLFADMNGDIGV